MLIETKVKQLLFILENRSDKGKIDEADEIRV